ncbi:hypothetical protein CBM2585_B50170 [Cupriavidus taiwanensis]|nr:hypothetical protein CBM2585_B50170 [Cupriavidus taiwanensis]
MQRKSGDACDGNDPRPLRCDPAVAGVPPAACRLRLTGPATRGRTLAQPLQSPSRDGSCGVQWPDDYS